MKGLSIVQDNAENASHCSVAPQINIIEGGNNFLQAQKFAGNASVITLGCAKNHVDSEVMLGVLRERGFAIVSDPQQADVAIINTCGFLQSAVKESVDCILKVADYKKTGRLRRLVVAGCMIERYGGDIKKELPEVDAFLGVNDLMTVGDAAQLDDAQPDILSQAARPYFLYDDRTPRQLATAPHTAWLKISEGCDRPCSFCIIPKIRGPLRSRSIESVVREVADLGARGVREINLVAQDSTAYGNDLSKSGEKVRLVDLLKALDGTRAVPWIRLFYAYPVGVDAELMTALRDLPTICEYLDVPLQHVSERVLRDMRRPLGKNSARSMVEFAKSVAPEVQLRTTFIVGFPGETEEDVRLLEEFVSEGHFSSVGVFTYSKEEGTPSFDLSGHVSEKEKRARRERVMLAQQVAQKNRLQSYVGKTLSVLVDGAHQDTELLLSGRTRFQAPEVDGCVIINDIEGSQERFSAGTICDVRITEIAGYDLVGTAILAE